MLLLIRGPNGDAVDGKKVMGSRRHVSKPRETTQSRSQAPSGLNRWGAGLDGRDRGRANQFDPAIDKERKVDQ
jgi:hypothetical protein